jgi:organic radical activating enzyme
MAHADMSSAYISEIFTSVEGEGVHAGRPATFIRFCGCNLACSYCDTKDARQNSEFMVVHGLADHRGAIRRGDIGGEAAQGGPEACEIRNPVASDHLVSLVGERLGSASTLVLTGGEPLLQHAFVQVVCSRLRMMGYEIHLETNGTLVDAFKSVRDVIDFVCMDLKLPSAQDGTSLMHEHRGFLGALGGKDAAVKILVTSEAGLDEIVEAVEVVASVNPHLPVLLQPAFAGSRPTVQAEWLLKAHALARRRLPDVRVSIQMHKVLGMR